MKMMKLITVCAIVYSLTIVSASAATLDPGRDQSQAGKMLHKLGRGIVNVFTCWVEIPRSIAAEWEKTDPVTGTFLGAVEGTGWGFTRFATGVFDTFTFPFPVPSNYESMIEPEFVVTDTWGDQIPGLTEFSSMDSDNPRAAPVYPQKFDF